MSHCVCKSDWIFHWTFGCWTTCHRTICHWTICHWKFFLWTICHWKFFHWTICHWTIGHWKIHWTIGHRTIGHRTPRLFLWSRTNVPFYLRQFQICFCCCCWDVRCWDVRVSLASLDWVQKCIIVYFLIFFQHLFSGKWHFLFVFTTWTKYNIRLFKINNASERERKREKNERARTI